MQQIFQDFIGHMAFVELEDKTAETVLYNLGKFSKVIADYELLFFKESAKYKSNRFMSHLNNVVAGLYPEGEEDNAYIRGDAVRLMTVHQSKGLEFAAVFIPALTQGVFPGGSFLRGSNITGGLSHRIPPSCRKGCSPIRCGASIQRGIFPTRSCNTFRILLVRLQYK